MDSNTSRSKKVVYGLLTGVSALAIGASAYYLYSQRTAFYEKKEQEYE
jgi:hypothetical protein